MTDAPIKVKRDGPRGWHYIAAAHFNPEVHELVDAPASEPTQTPPLEPAAAPAPAQKLKPAKGKKE